MKFEVFLDIIESSPIINDFDFEEETKWTKGVVSFMCDGKWYRAIFSHNFLEV